MLIKKHYSHLVQCSKHIIFLIFLFPVSFAATTTWSSQKNFKYDLFQEYSICLTNKLEKDVYFAVGYSNYRLIIITKKTNFELLNCSERGVFAFGSISIARDRYLDGSKMLFGFISSYNILAWGNEYPVSYTTFHPKFRISQTNYGTGNYLFRFSSNDISLFRVTELWVTGCGEKGTLLARKEINLSE